MAKSRRRVKRRPYESVVRAEGAAETRRSIVDAAHALFVERGYAAMTMREIAERAGVALDTVYAVVGKKPDLVRLLVEAAISSVDHAVPAEERDYVRQIRAARDARTKLSLYAAAVTRIHARLAPLARAIRTAEPQHPELAAMWREIADRRARNMRLLAKELQATGEARPDLDMERVGDVLWALADADVYLLFTAQRGWSPADYEAWLADAWIRLLLEPT